MQTLQALLHSACSCPTKPTVSRVQILQELHYFCVSKMPRDAGCNKAEFCFAAGTSLTGANPVKQKLYN